jgi:ferredoxin
MLFRICIEDSGESFACAPSQDVLQGMERRGKKGIVVGCRGGGCGVCKVQVKAGRYRIDKMSRACVTADEEADGIALACRLYPEDDLQIRVLGKLFKNARSSEVRFVQDN